MLHATCHNPTVPEISIRFNPAIGGTHPALAREAGKAYKHTSEFIVVKKTCKSRMILDLNQPIVEREEMKAIPDLALSKFEADAIDSETTEFNRMVENSLAGAPLLYTLEPRVIRNARAAGEGIFGPIRRLQSPQDRIISSSTVEVPVRIYRPEGDIRGVYLHFHGGGFMLGQIDQHDEILDELSRRTRVAIVTVDYRLAPENPYPAAPEDCEAVALWLAENCHSEFGTRRLLIGGESAGANLTVVTLLRMREIHQFTNFSAAILNYGLFDLALTPSARRWGERYLILTTKIIEWFNQNYITPDLRYNPDASPLYADLSSLPPAQFVVGTLDPLIDDTLFMYARWMAAGNRANLALYPGGIHAFNFFPIGIARDANRKIADFIDSILSEAEEAER